MNAVNPSPTYGTLEDKARVEAYFRAAPRDAENKVIPLTYDGIAEDLGMEMGLVEWAVLEVLEDSGTKVGAKTPWLTEPLRKPRATQPTLAGMPPPKEVYPRHRGIPVTTGLLSFAGTVDMADDPELLKRAVAGNRVRIILEGSFVSEKYNLQTREGVTSMRATFALNVESVGFAGEVDGASTVTVELPEPADTGDFER